MTRYNHIVVLTGAGLSAESGLHTFRDKDGIWSRYDYREVATPEGYHRNPVLVLNFYNERRRQNADVKPNAAHHALARLEAEYPGQVLVVTQNIDPLHEMAGSKNLIHMHGEIQKALCGACGQRHPIGHNDLTLATACPAAMRRAMCALTSSGSAKCLITWSASPRRWASCDLFLSIGTSGTVYPAAGFVLDARRSGAHTVELNLEPSEGISGFHEAIHGRATEVVPAYVERLLGAARR